MHVCMPSKDHFLYGNSGWFLVCSTSLDRCRCITDYPSGAVDNVLVYSGPLFSREFPKDTYDRTHSFLDILALPETKSRIPRWREAYLFGDLVCKITDEMDGTVLAKAGIVVGQATIFKIIATCGLPMIKAIMSDADVVIKPKCSTGKHLLVPS